MARALILLLSPLLLLLLVGCADPVTEPQAGDGSAGGERGGEDGSAQEPEDGSAPSYAPEDPADDGPDDGRQATPGDPDAPEADAAPRPAACEGPVVAAVGERIDAQLAAFARRDFPAALAEASPGFQAGTDAEAFRRLIERDYALLLEDASAEVERCAQPRADVSDVVAVIATEDGTRTRFLYRLRLEEQRWGIEAAVRLDPPPATA
ncbi:MAG: DUF4864 domain-containing protein [Nitriliruptoraceae bacterium]